MGKILFILDIAIAFLLMIKLMNAKNMEQRGTNTVTRFVRNSAAHGTFGMVIGAGAGATVFFCLFGAIFKAFYAGLPTLLPVVMSFIFKKQSTQDKQRVKDSRTVTKGSLEAGAAAGAAVGAVAGAGAVVVASKGLASKNQIKAGAEIGKGIGNSAGSVAKKAADKMTDVDSIDVTSEDMSAANKSLEAVSDGIVGAGLNEIQVPDPEKFLAAAKRVGIAKDDDTDVNMVAQKVYAMVPDSARELMKDKTEGEQAMLFLEGKV